METQIKQHILFGRGTGQWDYRTCFYVSVPTSTLKGQSHEKSVSNDHMGHTLGLNYETAVVF
jgi:hypothetical protein